MNFRYLTLFLLSISTTVFAQNTIKGKIFDGQNGEQLVSASINLITSSKVEVSKLDGSFSFKNLASGSYHIRAGYVGYSILDTTINVNKEVTNVLFYLKKNSTSLAEVTISGSQDIESQAYAKRAEQKSDNVANIISAKSIQLSPDVTVARGFWCIYITV